MRRRDFGKLLMLGGVVCGMIRVLMVWGSDTEAHLKTTDILIFVAVVAFAAGLALYALSRNVEEPEKPDQASADQLSRKGPVR